MPGEPAQHPDAGAFSSDARPQPKRITRGDYRTVINVPTGGGSVTTTESTNMSSPV
jgi:hypothetical protein